MLGVEMLDQHERETAVGGSRFDEPGERLESAGGGAERDDGARRRSRGQRRFSACGGWGSPLAGRLAAAPAYRFGHCSGPSRGASQRLVYSGLGVLPYLPRAATLFVSTGRGKQSAGAPGRAREAAQSGMTPRRRGCSSRRRAAASLQPGHPRGWRREGDRRPAFAGRRRNRPQVPHVEGGANRRPNRDRRNFRANPCPSERRLTPDAGQTANRTCWPEFATRMREWETLPIRNSKARRSMRPSSTHWSKA